MKDFIVGLVSLALSAFVYFYSKTFSIGTGGLSNDPAYYPRALAIIMALMSVALIVKSIPKLKEDKISFEAETAINIGKIIALLIAYILLLTTLGFIVSTLLFVFAGIMLFGGKISTSAKLFIPITGIIYVIFAVLFKMILPAGILF